VNVPIWQTRAAKAAYDAYKTHTGGRSAVTGAVLPNFDDLPPPVYNAWHAAAKAAVELGRPRTEEDDDPRKSWPTPD